MVLTPLCFYNLESKANERTRRQHFPNMAKTKRDARLPEFISEAPADYPEHITWQTLKESEDNIVALKINESYKLRKGNNTIKDNEPFNSRHIQACIEDSWRTPCKNLERADLILATLPLTSTMRAVVGVFEYAEVQPDRKPDPKKNNSKEYLRTHFTGVQPASDHRAAPFLGKLIVGINPRDTNPVRYFVDKSK